MSVKNKSAFLAILAAAVYAIGIPISKMLLIHIKPTMMAAFLYLGAGVGMIVYVTAGSVFHKREKKDSLTKKELPYTVAMVLLDILAPILLMIGITKTNSANVSLLNNFEIVATSIIALLLFGEVISKRLWLAIILVTISSVILSFEGGGAFQFNIGSLLVLAAATCWGLENNCTSKISNKSSEEIVIIKGCFSGLGSLIIALVIGESFPNFIWVLYALIVGFLAYGMSLNFYIMAQKNLGAAKTSAYYSVTPFLGVAFSMILLRERPGFTFYIALAIMAISTFIIIKDTVELQHNHEHEHTHTHEHRHGNLVHSHEHTHRHTHLHIHGNDAENHEHTHHELLGDHTHSHSENILIS